MNRDLKYRVHVMQAALDGKAIQFSCNNGAEWDDAIEPKNTSAFSWNWDSFDYRIAPEPRKPRECWAIFPMHNQPVRMFASKSQLDAMTNFAIESGDEVVHMREVLPDPQGVVVPVMPKRDAVIVTLVNGGPAISVECIDNANFIKLEHYANKVRKALTE